MRVLVTRPEEDAEETAGELAARGHQAVIAPLLEIKFREGDEVELDGVQAILITSANGIRALATRTQRRDVKILAVGAQSAAAARALGFRDVSHADGDAAALAELVIAKLAPKDGMLLHAAGADRRGNIAQALAGRGFAMQSIALYDAVAASALPDAARTALARGAVDAVLFFSPRTVRVFVELVALAGLAVKCRSILALCISRAAADELTTLDFREIRVAPQPNQDALLALLNR